MTQRLYRVIAAILLVAVLALARLRPGGEI